MADEIPGAHAQGRWASNRGPLAVDPALRAVGYNIVGRRVSGPMQGFGRLWRRTYTADLGDAVTPEALIADWRGRFGSFWPRIGRFHGAMRALEPGDVAPLTSAGVATGVLVLFADDTSFTFLTPQGHIFAAMITFSAERGAAGDTVARIDILLRTSDPLFEIAWPVLRRGEDVFWAGTLRNLAREHGVGAPLVNRRTECIDPARLWRNWRNVRDNSAIHSALHLLNAPLRRRRAARGR